MEYQQTVQEHQINSIEIQEAILERQAFMQYQEALMEYPGAFAEDQEALSNTMELYRTA